LCVAFFAVFKQELRAHADAEKGFVFQRIADGFGQPASVERCHTVGHRALAGEDNAVGGVDVLGAGSELDLGGDACARCGGVDRFLHGVEVAHAVVDDDGFHADVL